MSKPFAPEQLELLTPPLPKRYWPPCKKGVKPRELRGILQEKIPLMIDYSDSYKKNPFVAIRVAALMAARQN